MTKEGSERPSAVAVADVGAAVFKLFDKPKGSQRPFHCASKVHSAAASKCRDLENITGVTIKLRKETWVWKVCASQIQLGSLAVGTPTPVCYF